MSGATSGPPLPSTTSKCERKGQSCESQPPRSGRNGAVIAVLRRSAAPRAGRLLDKPTARIPPEAARYAPGGLFLPPPCPESGRANVDNSTAGHHGGTEEPDRPVDAEAPGSERLGLRLL